MIDEITNENNNNQKEMLNYKGYFVENGRDEEKKFFEYGAHFSYKELYITLMKLKTKTEKNEKVANIIPKKKLNLERNNLKDKKIEENINNIIKEFKMKTRSRNIAQQGNKVSLNKNHNQLTFVPLKSNQNKMNVNNINKSINKNQIIANINNKIRNLNNKYNITRNREQKFTFEIPIFFTDNTNSDITNENNISNNVNNLVNNNKINKNNKINNNINLYKSYQNQLKKRREIKLNNNNNNKYNIIKNNILNEKVNTYKKSRLLSSNFDNFLYKYHQGKFKFSPLKKIPTNNFPISGEYYTPYKFNNIINYSGNNMTNKKYRLKKFINHKHIVIDSINSFSAENKKKHISNSVNMEKVTRIKKNISDMTNASQNNSKNITFQNMLYDLNHSKKFSNQNKKINNVREGALTNYNESMQKSKIHNLFKLLNKHEKNSRNQNSNYFLNNTSYMQKTQQYDKNKNTKNIFLDLNNILMKKEKNRVKLTNQLLHNSRNITFNTNNKFFNTSYINNTTTQNNLHHDNFMNKIHTTQNKNNNNYNNTNMRKKPKKNNVNINININNNNKIIYNKVYEYKNPLPNINNPNLIKNQIPVKISNHINNPHNPKILRKAGSNNFNSNNNKIKFINIQIPKKKLLNKYIKNNNNYSNLFA